MARGSIGRERVVTGVLGLNHQTPVANHQEHDLNNELLAVIKIHFLIQSNFWRKILWKFLNYFKYSQHDFFMLKHLLIDRWSTFVIEYQYLRSYKKIYLILKVYWPKKIF